MKIARFAYEGEDHIGLVADGIIPIASRLPDAPRAMVDLIDQWDRYREPLAQLAVEGRGLALDSVRLLAPIPRPAKIMGIGLNYADHIAESGMEKPKDQMWFSKPPTAVTGPYDPIALPRVSTQLDYEAELVVVVGRRVRYADRIAAADAIFGYCAGNDVSVRDWQFRTGQFMIGKSFDTHAPHGPWIVTADEIDAGTLDISCYVNGEQRQASNTRYLIFDPADQVSHLSQVMTLEPGDLLFTGTPSGVGAVMDPPKWLKAGDRVRVEIGGIGAIENEVAPD